ncbi:RraA family protein [Jannaschia seohaensis]|uniref:Putative 4-hydroxy-4-methyl-2-oxoglutarate aldolase n=1 Tax=Jannaschia seohaensis TaxID=475081 RepID=A0A2Y9C2F2_9RHOB|nr:RraA family protein [Jannaschia seohaensis]PWJ15891.1 regulator of RNase E activity RraA [Jannaschia seohaensis]SSA49602.1 Regulator of RNase E activity RraA [Jannaschia seohaensis]
MTKPLPAPKKYVIGDAPPPLDPALIETLKQCETTMLGHILYWGAMDTGIRVNKGFGPRIAGRALTVQIPGPCSVMLHYAVGLAQPGDILVIDRLGDTRHACLGDGVAAAAMRQGIIGAIIDGPCTDGEELAELGFPVWCRGVSPMTTRMADLGGRAQVPVSVGGVPVLPGDAILADADGVYAMQADEAARVADIALTRGRMVAARRAARGDAPIALADASGAGRLVSAVIGEDA